MADFVIRQLTSRVVQEITVVLSQEYVCLLMLRTVLDHVRLSLNISICIMEGEPCLWFEV
jgi:hypothetical protein